MTKRGRPTHLRIEVRMARSASLGALPLAQQQEEVGRWMEEATDALNKYKLVEAEDLYWHILEHSSEHAHRDKHMVMCLTGLSEVYIKRGRTMRHNEMEWHRMYMHAITSQRKALEYAEQALSKPQDNQLTSWFQEQLEKGQFNLKTLENNVVKSLQDHLVRKEKTEKVSEGQNIDAQWLGGLQRYCKDRLEKGIERFGSKENLTALLDDDDDEAKQEPKEEKPKPPPKKRKKINYAKVQEAIQNLVKQISGDMRHRHMHQRLTQRNLDKEEYRGKILTPEEKLKCDTMSLIKPLSESLTVLHEFEEAFEEQQSLSPKESANSGEKYDELSPMSETAAEFESETGSDVMEVVQEDPVNVKEEPKIEAAAEQEEQPASDSGWNVSQNVQATSWKYGYGRREKTITFRRGQAPVTTVKNFGSFASNTTPPPEPAKPVESPKPVVTSPVRKAPPPQQDENRVIKGVLRVWKGYKSNQPEMILPLSPYKLDSFEELSPLTDILKVPHSQFTTKPSEEDEFEDKMPVSEMSLNVTFAHTLSKLADQMKDAEKLEEASDLYKCALGILLKNRQETGMFVAQVTHILLNLGMIKCQRGDFTGGSQLIEECIRMYEDSDYKDAEFHIARLWYELGNVYMMEQSRESTLFEHVMRTVREELTNEVRKELGEIVDDVSDDEDDSEGQSYWVSAQEALNCFNTAIEILRRRKMASSSGEGNVLYIKVLTKLGDCNIMTGDHDRAILFYEEALYLFRNSAGSVALPTNAHVLAMLGTANYMLGQYHKAVSMFETGHILQQHLYGIDDATFEVAFTLTMLGLSYYNMKHYHKCIAWCLKAFEIYTCLFKEKFNSLSILYRWFITQTLYTLGFSYGTLKFHDKCLGYLELALSLASTTEDADVKQKVRILKAIADEHTTAGQSESGLEYYASALELSGSLGNEQSATALQNQLLNRMAGVHVGAKQYNTAAQYLQQALDHQKNVEYTIKDDLIGILKQLGMTYALAGDVDRAIECYSESVEAYEEMTSVFASDIALTLGTLATLYHVKACIQDDTDDMNDLCLMAERCYKDAIRYDPRSSVCVQYANYLYQQTQWSDALLTMLPIVHINTKHLTKDNLLVQYNGVEQAILPEHITSDVDDYDEVTLETKIFAKFLAILCYKQLMLIKDAEDVLVDLYKMVGGSNTALNHSILGYALLEMGLYEEAANSFNTASSMEPNNEIPFVNCWISLCVWAFTSIENGVYNVLEYLHKKMEPARPVRTRSVRPSVMPQPLITSPRSPPLIRAQQSPPQQRSPNSPGQRAKFADKKPGPVIAKPVIIKPVSRRNQSESSDESPVQKDQDHLMVDEEYTRSAARDSGYYDHSAEDREVPWGSRESIPEEKRDHTEKMETLLTWRTSAEPLTKSSIIEQALKAAREKRERSASVEKDTRPDKDTKPDTFIDRGYNSSEYIERQGLEDQKQEENFQTWEEEEVVETPAAILQAMKGNVGGSYETALDHQLEDMGSETGTFTTTDSNYAESETYTVTDDVESNDEWHTEEVVVETPAAIIQAMRIAQEVEIETEYEKYKREEKERKARLERERAERKREQERQDRESQAAWQRVEETVESSLNILEALRTKREKSRSRETLDGQDSTGADEDSNWTITEEVVETPMAILQALSDAKKVLGESLGLDESEIERIASGGTLDSNSPPQEQDSRWQVYEEETPTAVLKAVQEPKSYTRYSESTPEDETTSSWTTSEEVVETPAIILNSRDISQDNRVNGMIHEVGGQATDEEDYEQERVWVTEEVVSTPTAILQAMETDNKNDSESRYSSRDSWTTREVSKPVIYDSWRTGDLSQRDMQHQEDYSNDNGHYRSEPSYYNSRSSYSYSSKPDIPKPQPEPEEEKWQVWESEETVDTPPEILALLRSQQVQ